jgi:hypothetical protein
VSQTVSAPAIYAPAAPALATLISTAPVRATPVEAKAVLTPVIKKYHKDHVSKIYFVEGLLSISDMKAVRKI